MKADLEERRPGSTGCCPRSPRATRSFRDDGAATDPTGCCASCSRDPHTPASSLSRNFGKSAGARTRASTNPHDVIAPWDADLQGPPQRSCGNARTPQPRRLSLLSLARRAQRPGLERPLEVYNFVTRRLTGVRGCTTSLGFKCYASVLDELQVYGERHRYIPVLASYRGFRIAEVKVEHQPRLRGKSKFGYERYFGGFFSLLTVILLTRYTNKPLHFFGFIGVVTFMAGFLIDLYLTVLWLFWRRPLSDRPILLAGTVLLHHRRPVLFSPAGRDDPPSLRAADNDYSCREIDATEVWEAKAEGPHRTREV